MKSECFFGSTVSFPEFTGERVYMYEFIPSNGLPKDLERWQETVDQMLVGVNAPGSVYLMIDQAEVKAGKCHRRPGLHVDGYWHAGIKMHGGNTGSHNPLPLHNPTPNIPKHIIVPNPEHRSLPEKRHDPMPTRHSMVGNYETLILASNIEGCEAFEGEWDGSPGFGGDCSHISREGLKSVVMRSGVAWLGETGTMLHSAVELSENALRTVVRLNVPGWVPN